MSALRILILRIGAMGDILHALPAVTALRRALPHAHIGWAVEPHWRPLLSPALLDQVHEVPTRDWKARPMSVRTLKQILALRDEFRAQHYDLAVDLQGSLRSAFLARLSGAPQVVGSLTPREGPATVFYTHRIGLRAPNVIVQAAELLSAATGLPLTPAAPMLPVSAAPSRDPYLLLCPTAGWGAKQWPAQAWNELVQRLEARGYRILVNTGALDDPILRDTRATAVFPALPELLELASRATLVAGGDTGPVHLAAALGVPTVALFGPTDPARNGPAFPGARARVLRHPDSTTDHTRHAATERGLAQIAVDEVENAILELLRESCEENP